jgi:Transposase DDE domain
MYRIHNWSKYNTGLKQRGSLTFWLDEEVLLDWLSHTNTGRRGASPTYSDAAILTMATLQTVFHLAGRQTQGFLESIFELMEVELPVPDHSTLSRRLKRLSITIPVMPKDKADSIPETIKQVSTDGAYDRRNCYDAIASRRAIATIPPRLDAKIWQHGNCKAPPHPRDVNIRRIRQIGRKNWKQKSGYHRRSLAETTMFRLKTIFGAKVRRRCFDNQVNELFIQCFALNRMIQIAKPESYLVET